MFRPLPILLLALAAFGCATDGKYVWVDELGSEDLKAAPYQVAAGDRLVVNVWNQPPLSGEVLVRPDGNITLPLVGDVQVVGATPQQASEAVARKLSGMVVEPHVVVSLSVTRAPTISVLGEVQQAGTFELRPGEGVLEVLARAGGLSEFARKDGIFVVRRSQGMRVRFDYRRLSQASGAGVAFVLQDGDVVVVE
ncbi:MAG: polysaccharide biosynthesis/export family protein [Deltaproteobacteria bacterium]|nr:polysaccharide biosynthesis/export family protein [Deltaproteobacteria bacterium]